MYHTYIKTGLRNLTRHKGYSFINIGGLAAGMAVAIFIALWIHDELAFNKYHENHSSIARVMRHIDMNAQTLTTPILPNALGEELRTRHGDQFRYVVMAALRGDHILSAGDTKLSMHGEYIEAAAPEMFTLEMLHGTRAALNDPHSIILSQSAAKTLFGNDDPMGQILTIDNSDRLHVKVTGIFEDLPHNTQFHEIKFYAPFELAMQANEWMQHVSFTNDFLNIYVAINERTNFESASLRIANAILDNVKNDPGYVKVNPRLSLHPMKDWHLRSEWKNGELAGGAIEMVWLFGIVGVFVLLLACINFMNLSTARSEKRAKEVGIRKAIGSARTQLVSQFLSESLLMTVMAFALALLSVAASLEWFNDLAGKQIKMPWMNVYFWSGSLIFIVTTGLLAGSYPALYLSSFNAVKVLKGSLRAGRAATIPRKVLVVIQFTASVTLIIGTIVVYHQIQFAKDRPVGYSSAGLMMVPMTTSDFHGMYDVLQTELKATGVVTGVAESSSPPTDIWTQNGGFDWRGKDPAFIPQFATLTVTPEYGTTVGWQFVKGRDFSKDIASDSAAFVINETAAKLLGFGNPVGETVQWAGGWRSQFTRFTVIGVVKDMVMKSPYAPPVPSVFFLSKYGTNWINLRIDASNTAAEALPKIESVFRKLVPSAPFDYKFADQEYATKFAAEERVGKLSTVFAVLAILISCLGLFGLSSFIAERRTKEIGIRKVVGASVFSLWKMLSKDFIVLVLISCIISFPISYYVATGWLSGFDYRTGLSWWIFGIVSIGALAITLITVSFQSIKAAMTKPVDSLRAD